MQHKLKLKNVLFFAIVLLTLASCKKEKETPPVPIEPLPTMEYFTINKDLKDNESGFSIDVNHDGVYDIAFKTLLVGDPLYQVDKHQFLITSNIGVNLPVNNVEAVPVMESGDVIVSDNFNGYRWYELSSILLVQKVISATAPAIWEGHWKTAVHKYLPFQIIQNNKRYNGWVELSVDVAAEKIVVHNAAISKEAEKMVKAGK